MLCGESLPVMLLKNVFHDYSYTVRGGGNLMEGSIRE